MGRIQKIGVSIIIIGICVILATCGYIILTPPQPSEPPEPTLPSLTLVVYELTGSARNVDITLNNATGGVEQYSQVPLPQTIVYENFTGDFVYISAQNCGESGWIRVTIYVNGKAIKSSTSSGAYVIANASDSLWKWR